MRPVERRRYRAVPGRRRDGADRGRPCRHDAGPAARRPRRQRRSLRHLGPTTAFTWSSPHRSADVCSSSTSLSSSSSTVVEGFVSILQLHRVWRKAVVTTTIPRRFDYDSTEVRLPFDCSSTVRRPTYVMIARVCGCVASLRPKRINRPA